MSRASGTRLLHQLAHLYGVQTAYYDVSHHRQQAPAESLLEMLHALGAPLANLQGVPTAWREQRLARWQRMLEPVSVAWEDEPSSINIRLPSSMADARFNLHLKLESGETQRWQYPGSDLPALDFAEIEGTQYVVKHLPLPDRLPQGYHCLTLELLGRPEEALIIVAPHKAYIPANGQSDRMWGAFLPLYALHTQKSRGGGDFSDLESLANWLAGLGGQVIATLPILAAFLDEPFQPSPYLPASRLFWNEFYLDLNKVPEMQSCPAAQALLESSPFQKELNNLRNSPLVDYRRQMVLKRRVLEELCRSLFAGESDRLEALHHFAEAKPEVEGYARFRAAIEKQRGPWQSWPQPLREGVLKEGDYNEENRRYHQYVQWLVHQQMDDISKKVRGQGLKLYLDLPVGVHPSGYDVWRQRDVFITGASAGAPPDAVFRKGQDWEFPPLHPEKIREQGYRYTIAYLRHHLQHAAILRIDHVMGLHRLFCIPGGLEASQGLYLSYRADELYAILALESQRHKAIIVGEDLGTVPPYVRPAMKRHGLQRMYVVHYELAASPQRGLRPIPQNSVVSLNTHDMPPFAAFWQGLDIAQRLALGHLTSAGASAERKERQTIKEAMTAYLRAGGWLKQSAPDVQSALEALLSFLSASKSRLAIVNLEDLWQETEPQNVPSTGQEQYPNWQRKARYDLEEFCQMPRVIDTLRMIDRIRKQGR